jgi:hypothetical protein
MECLNTLLSELNWRQVESHDVYQASLSEDAGLSYKESQLLRLTTEATLACPVKADK